MKKISNETIATGRIFDFVRARYIHNSKSLTRDIVSTHFKASVVLRKETVEIRSLDLGSYGSRLKGKGYYSEGKSSFKTDIALFIESVKRFFNLRQKGDGKISAEGEVRFGKVRSLNDIFIDLKLKGDFYLETLMELVKVEDPLEGHIEIKEGEIKGPLPNISGKAKVRFRKGMRSASISYL